MSRSETSAALIIFSLTKFVAKIFFLKSNENILNINPSGNPIKENCYFNSKQRKSSSSSRGHGFEFYFKILYYLEANAGEESIPYSELL
jgi:hypothetical protein